MWHCTALQVSCGVCEDLELGGVRRATWGHQELDAGTCGMGTRDAGRGTRDVKNRDAGTLMIIEKVGGNCNISHFPLEYVLVNETLHPTLLMLQYSS